MKTKQEKILIQARSLFERLKTEKSTDDVIKQLKIILQNAELWKQVQKDLGVL